MFAIMNKTSSKITNPVPPADKSLLHPTVLDSTGRKNIYSNKEMQDFRKYIAEANKN